MDKVYFLGTHRCRAPDQTLAAVTPLLAQYGITRLADVTGLDTLRVPVVMAVRPLALTLTVAQGKGVTLEAARASAAMEAIEVWHGEFAVPPASCSAPAADLSLGYPVSRPDSPSRQPGHRPYGARVDRRRHLLRRPRPRTARTRPHGPAERRRMEMPHAHRQQ